MSLPFAGGADAGVTSETALAQLRVTRLATQLPVHRAFHWLHLHPPQLRQWQLEFLAIPAPPFGEEARARWFLERFAALGLSRVHLDDAGNALAELPSATHDESGPVLLLSAHLDTVFPADAVRLPLEDGPRILCPGACDNGAGLAALLAIAACLRFAAIVPPVTVLFAANVGEEGLGDLRGMRALFAGDTYGRRICAALVLEGAGTAAVVSRGLGSRRFRVTISGPGGHSWSDAGLPNPIVMLSRGIALLADRLNQSHQGETRTVLSPGEIAGGTSINAIPQAATVLLDLRSTDPAELDRGAIEIHRTFEAIVAGENQRVAEQSATPAAARLAIDAIGNRPAAELPFDSPLLRSIRAVDRHLGLRTELRLGSTDANLPLSLGVPAVALASGGLGGGIHTTAEWYDPTGRESALRRILLILLDTAQTLRT
jgi:acetylornithine deacetylase/succinyl-diaminopimelate desuccinylase-like protein